MGNKAIELSTIKHVNVLFSYEEALGFCCGDVVFDKDGLLAAVIFLNLCNELVAEAEASNKSSNNIIYNQLQNLYGKYGEYVSYNSYVISHDANVTDNIFKRLRNSGGNITTNDSLQSGYWKTCAGVKIITIKDITLGYDSTITATSDRSQLLPTTPDSHMIMFDFENGVSVTLRTSGTEPKIKFYTEIAGKIGQKREELLNILQTFVNALVDEMLQPDVHGLARA